MLKIAHLSDLHYSNGAALVEVDRCVAFAAAEAIAHQVQCVVVTGDATDHALDIHSPAVDALARRIRELADHCPVLMLQGTFSHEPPGTLNVFRLLGGRYPVHVADRIMQVALMEDGSWSESPGWHFDAVPDGAVGLFSCIPTVNKATVAAAVGAQRAGEAVGEQMTVLLRGFQPGHQEARARGIPTVLMSHGTVTGCTSEHGVPMAGLDHEFTSGSLFAAGASATMLGHIHLLQSWEEGSRRIAYAGSIARLHYGEIGDKGFLLWAVDADSAEFEQVQTPTRRTLDVAFEGEPNLAELERMAAAGEFEGAFVRVTWTVNSEDSHTIDREAIQRALGSAAEVKLVGRVVPITRSRAEGVSKAASLLDKVGIWAQATGSEVAPLRDCLEALAVSTPEQIAATVLGYQPAEVGELAASQCRPLSTTAAPPADASRSGSDAEFTLSLFGT